MCLATCEFPYSAPYLDRVNVVHTTRRFTQSLGAEVTTRLMHLFSYPSKRTETESSYFPGILHAFPNSSCPYLAADKTAFALLQRAST